MYRYYIPTSTEPNVLAEKYNSTFNFAHLNSYYIPYFIECLKTRCFKKQNVFHPSKSLYIIYGYNCLFIKEFLYFEVIFGLKI